LDLIGGYVDTGDVGYLFISSKMFSTSKTVYVKLDYFSK
jgi:hypothetical protein